MRFPEKFGGGSVEMTELSLHNLIEAFKNFAEKSGTALAYGCAKFCIVTFNNTQVEQGSPGFETWWNKLNAKKRQLVLEAYTRQNIPTKEERQAVISSIKEVEKDEKNYYQAIIGGKVILFGDVSMEQLLGISQKANDNAQLMNLYACMNSISFVDDKALSDKTAFMESLSAKERQLCISAFNEINSVSDEDIESFFDSAQAPSGQ